MRKTGQPSLGSRDLRQSFTAALVFRSVTVAHAALPLPPIRSINNVFSLQAPQVDGELVQSLRVILQGRFFKMTEERKVMFRSYLPLTLIQTDKPIYNPGQIGEQQMTLG